MRIKAPFLIGLPYRKTKRGWFYNLLAWRADVDAYQLIWRFCVRRVK